MMKRAKLRFTSKRSLAIRVYYETGESIPTTSAPTVEGGQLKTREMRVNFIAVDSKGQHETGPVKTWTNELVLKHKVSYRDGKYFLVLQSTPGGAVIRYSTDGSNPKQGGIYNGIAEIPASAVLIQAYAEREGISSKILSIPPPRDGQEGKDELPKLDPNKPVFWRCSLKKDSRSHAFEALGILGKHDARLRGFRAMLSSPQDSDQFFEISTGQRLGLTSEQAEKMILGAPPELVAGMEVTLTIRSIQCGKIGQV